MDNILTAVNACQQSLRLLMSVLLPCSRLCHAEVGANDGKLALKAGEAGWVMFFLTQHGFSIVYHLADHPHCLGLHSLADFHLQCRICLPLQSVCSVSACHRHLDVCTAGDGSIKQSPWLFLIAGLLCLHAKLCRVVVPTLKMGIFSSCLVL